MANHSTGFVQVLGNRKAAGYRKIAEQMARDMESPTAKDNPDVRLVLRRLKNNLFALANMVDPIDVDLYPPAGEPDITDIL